MNTNKKLHISDCMKHSLIEEWKRIRLYGCGNKYQHSLIREEKQYFQKRYLEINRILLINSNVIRSNII